MQGCGTAVCKQIPIISHYQRWCPASRAFILSSTHSYFHPSQISKLCHACFSLDKSMAAEVLVTEHGPWICNGSGRKVYYLPNLPSENSEIRVPNDSESALKRSAAQSSPETRSVWHNTVSSPHLPTEVWLRILLFALPHDETFHFTPHNKFKPRMRSWTICVHRLMLSDVNHPSTRGPGTVHDLLPNVSNLSLVCRRFMDMTYEIFYGGNNFFFEIAYHQLTSSMMGFSQSWHGSWYKVIVSCPDALAPLSDTVARYLTSLTLVVSVLAGDANNREWKRLEQRMKMIADIFRGRIYSLKRLFIDVGFIKCETYQRRKLYITDRLEGYRSPWLILKLTSNHWNVAKAHDARTKMRAEQLIRPLRCLEGLREVQMIGAVDHEDVSSFREAVMLSHAKTNGCSSSPVLFGGGEDPTLDEK